MMSALTISSIKQTILTGKNKRHPYGCLLYFVKLLTSLFDSNCNCNSHTNHGVVTCADETHHFYVCGNGGRTCELRIRVHTTHRVGHTIGSGACCHVVGVQGTSGTAARSNGEVVYAVLVAPLLVSACNGVLEAGRIGGVTGDGNANVFLTHDSNAFRNVVGTVALNLSAGTVGEGNFSYNGNFLGSGVKLGFNIGEAVDTGDDVCCILAETVQDNAEVLGTNLVCVQSDLDCAFCCCEGLVTCEEAEALGLFGEKHLAEVTVAETNLTVFSNGTGDAEALQTDTDSGSGVCSLGATLLDCDSSAYGVSPLCVLKCDRLGLLYDLVGVDALSRTDFLALIDGGNAVFFQSCENFRLASFITLKICHYVFPPLIIRVWGRCT